jgi:hypothetical protein
MKKLLTLASMTLLALAVASVDLVPAAPPIGTAKARGDYNWSNSSGGRSMRHARDYSRGYRTYARQTQQIMPQYARQEEAGVGQNIATAQMHFKEVRKTCTDKEALASLTVIDKQLVEAANAHLKMHEMCKMEIMDGVATMQCCKGIDAALDKAIAEHEKLTKRLEG